MARNFSISVRRKKGSLHMELVGDFDGSSAFELLNMLKKNCANVKNVFINTSSLDTIYSFGRDVLSKNYSELNIRPLQIRFTGKNVGQVYPEREIVF